MTTKKQMEKDTIVQIIKKATANSAFDNVARVSISQVFSMETGELYGKGMPRFNNALTDLINEGIITRTFKGRNAYLALA